MSDWTSAYSFLGSGTELHIPRPQLQASTRGRDADSPALLDRSPRRALLDRSPRRSRSISRGFQNRGRAKGNGKSGKSSKNKGRSVSSHGRSASRQPPRPQRQLPGPQHQPPTPAPGPQPRSTAAPGPQRQRGRSASHQSRSDSHQSRSDSCHSSQEGRGDQKRSWSRSFSPRQFHRRISARSHSPHRTHHAVPPAVFHSLSDILGGKATNGIRVRDPKHGILQPTTQNSTAQGPRETPWTNLLKAHIMAYTRGTLWVGHCVLRADRLSSCLAGQACKEPNRLDSMADHQNPTFSTLTDRDSPLVVSFVRLCFVVLGCSRTPSGNLGRPRKGRVSGGSPAGHVAGGRPT